MMQWMRQTRPARHRPRRGQSTAGVAAVIAAVFGAAAATLYFVPASLQAEGGAKQHITEADDPDHQQVIEHLAAMLARSYRIEAIRRDPVSDAVDVTIWLEAEHPDTGPTPGELAVLRHSPVMQTVTLHHAAGVDGDLLEPWWGWIEQGRLDQDEFARSWRTDPEIHRQVLAVGVSDFELTELELADVEQQDAPDSPDHARLKLSLIWPVHSADAPDRASLVVDVRRGDWGRTE